MTQGKKPPGILKAYFRLKQIKYSHHFRSDKVDVLSEECEKKLMLNYEACFTSVNPECSVIFPDAIEDSSFWILEIL